MVYLIEHSIGKGDKFVYDDKKGWHISMYRQTINTDGEIQKYGVKGTPKTTENCPNPNKLPDYACETDKYGPCY